MKNKHYTHEKLANDLFTSIEQIKSEILESPKHFFMAQKNLLTSVQWKTLKAIAKKQSVKNVTSSEFLKFSGLAKTSARRSVEMPLDKELLLIEGDEIKVYNVFFARFFERME